MSIYADFEDAAACGDKLQRTDALLELQEFDRQTDGLWLIVSSRAIFDRYFRFHPGLIVPPTKQQVKASA